MHLRRTLAALGVSASIVNAVPTRFDHEIQVTPVEQGLNYESSLQKRDIIIQQTVVENNIIIVQNNLDTVAQLALIAEQQFAALVQSQIALISQVETIKNNIRINHFKAKWPSVNTVIVTVTQLLDVRNNNASNSRYLVNQLLADNGQPNSEIVIMVTADAPLTIGLPTPSIDIAGILSSASAVSTPTAAPIIAGFDAAAPFGRVNQSLILPYGSSAPTLANIAQIFADPASIILPGGGGRGLFVQELSQFGSACSLWGANGLSLFNLQAALVLAEQVAAVQLAGLQLGAGLDAIIADQLLKGLAEQQRKADEDRKKKAEDDQRQKDEADQKAKDAEEQKRKDEEDKAKAAAQAPPA